MLPHYSTSKWAVRGLMQSRAAMELPEHHITANAYPTFVKSAYVGPYLSSSSVQGLFAVKDDMPSLWGIVDANISVIMGQVAHPEHAAGHMPTGVYVILQTMMLPMSDWLWPRNDHLVAYRGPTP
ncbi:hypothetical protein GGR56DRAFT_70899 [Xylariaceae sp. FL0804]|nr:hypothetical protein GGR56DRAFT_70899 [Xylariaceae sp. FL0804]